MVLTTSVGTALAIASSVELRHRKLVDDFIPFMSESSRRGRCRHRYATRLRSSTEFDSIVPVEYRAVSQVLRFACQRRALLTTGIRRPQRAGRPPFPVRGVGAERKIRPFFSL